MFYSSIPPPSHGGPFKCYVMQWGGGGGLRWVKFPEKSVTNVYGSTLLALRGGGWVGVTFQGGLRNTLRGSSVTDGAG